MATKKADQALDMTLDDVIAADGGEKKTRGGKGGKNAVKFTPKKWSADDKKDAEKSDKAADGEKKSEKSAERKLDMSLDEVIDQEFSGETWKGGGKGKRGGGKGEDGKGGKRKGKGGWAEAWTEETEWEAKPAKKAEWTSGGGGNEWKKRGNADDAWGSSGGGGGGWKNREGGGGKWGGGYAKEAEAPPWIDYGAAKNDSWGGSGSSAGAWKGGGKDRRDAGWGGAAAEKKNGGWGGKKGYEDYAEKDYGVPRGDGGGSARTRDDYAEKDYGPPRGDGGGRPREREEERPMRSDRHDREAPAPKRARHAARSASPPPAAPRRGARTTCRIKVTNIPKDLDRRDIRDAFEASTGPIKVCEMDSDGTAWIVYCDPGDAVKAKETFDLGELNNKTIGVTLVY